MTLHDGARLFVAEHGLSAPALFERRRYGFYCLVWLSGGAATFVCDAERFEAGPNSLVCIAPGQVNWWEHPEPGARLTMLGFLPELFSGGGLDVHLITDLPFFRPDGATVVPAPSDVGLALATLFQQAWQRYMKLATLGSAQTWRVLPRRQERLLLAYLHAILAEAAALDFGVAGPAHAPPLGADLRLARLFRMHAATGAVQRLPVGHYAALLHVTPDHLTRVVRRATGKPPSAWLQEHLLTEARRLLTLTQRPIEQIAEDLHFSSATQFSQWFRARSGHTPSRARSNAASDFQQI